ncbi:Alpha/Beta hydrolase protein [Cercophora newfieldiana]|uniref:Alpha/Beta hydrolase protein n=1 Tax=Cercophora newfieldiana TaxID=92897 RepID=A0AA39Y6T7_9PEZI|nr:Alpha/Beta hydrolase protein [Cercophora newfieldiana]
MGWGKFSFSWHRSASPQTAATEDAVHHVDKSPLLDSGPPDKTPEKGQGRQDTLHILKLPSDSGKPALDIVAIHGLNGHWQKSWTNRRDTSELWLRDLLPEKFPGARIMSFEYDARAVGAISSAGVREHADNLIKLLRNEREDNEDKNRPIVFIGHSLGGIIIKQALKKASDEGKKNGPGQADALDIANSTKGLIFFGTPHRGSNEAEWAEVISGVVSTTMNRPKSELLETLRSNSDELMNISEDFAPLAPRYAIASFYEANVHPVLGRVVVEKASAVMGLPHEETMMLGGDHSSMCKLGRNDQRWDPVWRAIRRCSRGV